MTIPFQQQGNGVTFTADTTAPTAVQCRCDNNVLNQQYVIANNGSVSVFVGIGATSAQATQRSVIPTSTPAWGYVVFAGTKEVVTGPVNAWFSGITASSTAAVYVYPGFEK